MAPKRPRPRRLLLPILLAAALAAEITGLAIARSVVPSGPAAPATAAGAMWPSAPSAGRLRDDSTPPAPAVDRRPPDGARDPRAIVAWSRILPAGGVDGAAKPASPVGSTRVGSVAPAASTSSSAYHGRNHVWIPALGINRAVVAFSCSRTRPPDNFVYRWGCSGRNNVYLLGHAYSVFKPLHDAYVGGRLRKGLKVMYAGGSGTVHTYSVIWWKVVAPTAAASWAWAPQSRPSMTLQTCVGANSQYRLMVRLVQVG